MSELSEQQLDELRRSLLAQREDLEGTLGTLAEAARPVDLDEPIGRVSRMDALQQQSLAKAQRGAAQLRLRLIDAALARLEEGEYGLCLDCGESVQLARLRVRPESPFCLACQSRRESRR